MAAHSVFSAFFPVSFYFASCFFLFVRIDHFVTFAQQLLGTFSQFHIFLYVSV